MQRYGATEQSWFSSLFCYWHHNIFFYHKFLNWKASEANWRRKIRNYFVVVVVQCQDTFPFVILCVISVLFAWQRVASSHCIIIHGMKNLELHKLSLQWEKNYFYCCFCCCCFYYCFCCCFYCCFCCCFWCNHIIKTIFFVYFLLIFEIESFCFSFTFYCLINMNGMREKRTPQHYINHFKQTIFGTLFSLCSLPPIVCSFDFLQCIFIFSNKKINWNPRKARRLVVIIPCAIICTFLRVAKEKIIHIKWANKNEVKIEWMLENEMVSKARWIAYVTDGCKKNAHTHKKNLLITTFVGEKIVFQNGKKN